MKMLLTLAVMAVIGVGAVNAAYQPTWVCKEPDKWAAEDLDGKSYIDGTLVPELDRRICVQTG